MYITSAMAPELGGYPSLCSESCADPDLELLSGHTCQDEPLSKSIVPIFVGDVGFADEWIAWSTLERAAELDVLLDLLCRVHDHFVQMRLGTICQNSVMAPMTDRSPYHSSMKVARADVHFA